MSITTMLEQAAGGRLFAAVATALNLDEAAVRNTMVRLCPAIAEALHDKAAADEELFQSLLDLIEDGAEAASLDAPTTLTGAEAIADGNQILADLYGSRAKAVAALRTAGGTIAEADVNTLAPVCATCVVAALARANQPLALSAAQPRQAASGSGGIIGTLISAIIAGIVAALAKQLAPRRRRATTYATARTRRRTTAGRAPAARRSRTASASLENVFRDILGKLGK